MLAARTARLSLFVHAVDDFGALCGARPAPRWRLSRKIPLTCPRCLWALSRPRYAVCGLPSDSGRDLLHIREVGPEGMRKKSGTGAVRTLCGRLAGWDLSTVTGAAATSASMCQSCRDALFGARRERQRENLFAR